MLRRMCAVALVFVLFVGMVSAAEPLPEEPAVEAVAEAAPWWLDIAESVLNGLWKLGVPLFFAWLVKKAGDREALKAALQALEVGVNQVWVEPRVAQRTISDSDRPASRRRCRSRAWLSHEARTKRSVKRNISRCSSGMGALCASSSSFSRVSASGYSRGNTAPIDSVQ